MASIATAPASSTAIVAHLSRAAARALTHERSCDPCTGARDLARKIAQEDEWITSRRERKKVEMLFAHLKRILRLDRLRLRGPNGARDEFHLAAAAQNLRKMAKIIPMTQPAMA